MQNATLLTTGLLDYQSAWDLQKSIIADRIAGNVPDTLIMTEHPHTYTLGKTGREDHLVADELSLQRRGITVYRIDRGGDITYHGPGQIVGYPILDLHNHFLDLHKYLRALEEVLILTLSDYGIAAGREEGMTGVWIDGAKIAAIGVKVSRWVTMHGFAFNVNTDLSYFNNIVPCGISDKPVTSLAQLLGREPDHLEVEEVVASRFAEIFHLKWLTATEIPTSMKAARDYLVAPRRVVA